MNVLSVVFLLIFQHSYIPAPLSIELDQDNFDAWLPQQVISGKIVGGSVDRLLLHVNGISRLIGLKNSSSFSCRIDLQPGKNEVWLSTATGVRSRKLTLRLPYRPMPLIKPYIITRGNEAWLCKKIITRFSDRPFRFNWIAEKGNPAPCKIRQDGNGNVKVQVPPDDGRYFFTLMIRSGTDSVRYSTYLTRHGQQVTAFDLEKDHAPWTSQAILYEITPSKFVSKGNYDAIRNKLPELKEMGINTIWLQPLFTAVGGDQGYDVVDYFSLRPGLGTEAQLQRLVRAAKDLHIRILLDFVPNHTSRQHPYAQDCRMKGHASHYYPFYQHENDGAAYSSFYHKDKDGFIYYFWNELVNLDYRNPEVQQWMIEACTYWLRKLDIDGYRFDALWGVRARSPEFLKKLGTALKSIKPDLLLLAEDKRSNKAKGLPCFDAAYDWTADTSWVSQWSWNYNISRRHYTTVFNFPDAGKRVSLLRQALFGKKEDNPGISTEMVMHFIENNDQPRFLSSHSVNQEKEASALVFMLPGIPLIYNGQETGARSHPYSPAPVFKAQASIQSLDSNHLFAWYQKLIRIRQRLPALRSVNIRELPLPGNHSLLAFYRWEDGAERSMNGSYDSLAVPGVQRSIRPEDGMGAGDCIVIINLDSSGADVELPLAGIQKGGVKEEVTMRQQIAFRDVLADEVFTLDPNQADRIKLAMRGYAVRCLVWSHPIL